VTTRLSTKQSQRAQLLFSGNQLRKKSCWTL